MKWRSLSHLFWASVTPRRSHRSRSKAQSQQGRCKNSRMVLLVPSVIIYIYISMILIRNSISILSMPVCFLSYSRSFTCWIWMDMDGYSQICSPEIKWQFYSYSDVLPGVLAVRQSQTPLPARVSRSGGGAKSSVGDVFYFESPQFWDQNKTGHAFPI